MNDTEDITVYYNKEKFYLKIEPPRPRSPRRKFYLQATRLSFLPDVALDSVLDGFDLSADGMSVY